MQRGSNGGQLQGVSATMVRRDLKDPVRGKRSK